ncbi:pilus assembly protein [Rhodoferax antarcticus]|uniref:pilus assembly protein n=1 Tax=Rhodoferax antarcticus TaxID=81479 RepID=UPI002224572E|nr:PilC/PilY family type IV pilus protein [Rhodoferax antarcticus]MCW2314231.1 type IV pilus assembly protein PilY1 [Rhodoferax antarcticus]
MKNANYFSASVRSVALVAAAVAALAANAVIIPGKPLVTQMIAKPMVMLVAGKDHKLFYEAYNDSGDIDGDGYVDYRFKPKITYYGLFDSKLCYAENGAGKGNSGLFTPHSAAGALATCSGKWSGNWLNYITTSRIDSMRKVLYGGYREVDSATQTILRRAYIPQDAHSWAKEYTSPTADGYKISDYTPLTEPTGTKRHFFGNLTANAGVNCKTLDDCSGLPPLMSVVTDSSKRVWQWASTERPVLADGTHGGTRVNYTVRVEVCTNLFNEGCKKYGTVYKPIGLLHEYGENDAMLFGMLTGSYDQNMSGGVLRKVVSSFKDEVSATDGTFTSAATIVKTFDRLRIRDFNNDRTDNAYKGGWLTTSAMGQGTFPDWGNPVGEMMYEATRYFAGKKAATGAFSTSSTKDGQVGLSTATWDDPYSSSSAAKAPWCAKANFMTISDINPSFDSDQVPGSSFVSFTGDLAGLNVSAEADAITALETDITGLRFIGESGAVSDSAPTAKTVSSLGTIRGLAPEEPTKQGSYYAASIAYFAKRSDIRGDLQGKQSVDTFSVALASPLPRMEIKLGTNTVTLVPFAKSIGGDGISNTKGNFQPTNQIVDFYVEKIANTGPKDQDNSINGGLYYAKFNINYEDVEQGADHDMDAIVEYEIKATSGGKVQVTLTPTYQAGGIQHRIGYVISGTTKDGVYLVVQDENEDRSYFLNVPPGRDPGYCDNATVPAECGRLPNKDAAAPLAKMSDITFTPSATATATLLKDPLWYAAKWGGFNDLDADNKPNRVEEWDADKNGVPDTYFLVQNPLKLKEALSAAFRTASEKSSSASNVIANSTSTSAETQVFQARFDAKYWSGDLVAYPVDANAGVSTAVVWRASDRIPAPASRSLFIHTPSGVTHDFLGSSFSDATDKALLDTDPSPSVDTSSDVVNYLRGDHTKEFKSAGTFRDRSANVLGDIVHSSPFYVKESETVYVGGNDGMLHAFKANNTVIPPVFPATVPTVIADAGTEYFGFIPSEVVSRLKNLTSTAYDHEFFVDGDIVVTPIVSETGSKNLLFAALGRGGKGLFGLDVTTPSSFSASKFLWEYTPTGSTVAAADNDLGLMLGRPIYAKMNDGSAAIIVGNGYNSTSGKAVLYIFRLTTTGAIDSVIKLDTLAGSDNGLATPGVFDADGDGDVDLIYAGDLLGNVWKFDVGDASAANWKVDLTCTTTTCTPLFVAKDASNNLQPITAPMSVAIDNVVGDTHEGKKFIFFGTGSYFRSTDAADTATQTWYGLIDEAAAIANRAVLKERNIVAVGTFDGKPVRAFSLPAVNDMVGKKGWFIDLDTPAGERIITKSNIFKLALPSLVASSIVPNTSDPCSAGGSGYINAISPFSGGAIATGILDVNNNKNYTDDLVSTYAIGSVDVGVGMPSEAIQVGRFLVVGGTDPVTPVGSTAVNLGSQFKGRLSWREIIKD